MWVTSSLTTVLTPTAVALGNFDGVHRGHQQVFKPVLPESPIRRSLAAFPPTGGGWVEDDVLVDTASWECHNQALSAGRPYATVVTFHPHPRQFFSGKAIALLTSPDEKVRQLHLLGVEQLVMLPFNRELADLSHQEFIEKILLQHLKAKRVSVGQDFCFGRGRSGTSADLQLIAAQYGVEVIIVPNHNSSGERISSSIIRQALQAGEIDRANSLLGRPYTIAGVVEKGQQLGRTLGFPTANLQLPPEKLLPRFGVYAVRVSIEQEGWELANKDWEAGKMQSPIPHSQSATSIAGVMNVGCRPTVNGTNPTVEVHLLDWSGDLYGKTLTVSLEKFLRSEQKFASLEALKAQIQADCNAAKAILGER